MDEFSALYRLAVTCGYKANIVKMGRELYDPMAHTQKANFPDVEITRPEIETDLGRIHDKCLMTVNGYVYPTEFFENRLYIPEATESLIRSRKNQLGILSFNKMNTNLKRSKITANHLSTDEGYDYFNKVILTFPDEVGDCFLVLAGYLIFEQPGFFYRISDRSFVLRLDKLNYIERIYELSHNRDIYDALGLDISVNNPNAFEADQARSNEVVERFLTLNNSFLVETPNHYISTNKIYLEHSNVPGNFRTEIEPTYPLVSGFGKVLEYKTRKNNDVKYSVYVNDAYMNNHLFTKMSTHLINMYNDNRVVGNAYQLSRAFFLDILLTPYN